MTNHCWDKEKVTSDPRYESFMGLGPRRIVHWEHWSNPDAETYLTGIDYYVHPRLCRLKLEESLSRSVVGTGIQVKFQGPIIASRRRLEAN